MKLIDPDTFESVFRGRQVNLTTLKNKNGMVAQITNYGGRVVSLWTKDKHGELADIVLGYASLDGYLNSNEAYFGALIGRYGNRIANGQFSIGDSVYTLATNNGSNHLHGGLDGFHNVVWDVDSKTDSTLVLSHFSPEGQEGYPGNLDVKVVYSVTQQDELKIEYFATADSSTPVNLTHHSFFNLGGQGMGSINDHVLQINSSYYTPVSDGLIPTGELRSVASSPFDFRASKRIGRDLDLDDQQLIYGFGYDHNFVIDGEGLRSAAIVQDPKSGRTMEVLTDEPGLQFYGGNFLGGQDIGKGNLSYEYRSAFCLETQHFPDSPNQSSFPSTILRPGKEYSSTCIYKFSVN